MRIGVIGWGSLIWDPGILKLETGWESGGPALPLEFSRISGGRLLTLAILIGSEPQETFWSISAFGDLTPARKNLRERARTIPDGIRYLTREGKTDNKKRPELTPLFQKWLSRHPDLDAVIWVALESNWELRRKRAFSAQDGLEFLKGLQVRSMAAEAEEYFRKAPPEHTTPLRRLVEEKLLWTLSRDMPSA